MARLAVPIFAILAIHSVQAIEPPASLDDARLELRAGVTPAAALDDAARGKSPSWVGWSVPAIPSARGTCCFTRNFQRAGCSLGDPEGSWGTSGESDRSAAELYVFVATKDGRPNRVRVMSPGCPIDGAGARVVWLGPVVPGASVAALSRLLDDGRPHDSVGEPALAAIAYHESGQADALLERRAFDRSLSREARQQAVFWAGNARGEAGYRLIERLLTTEAAGDLREHAVFALTQSPVPGAIDRIKRVSLEDRDGHVRAQALFWLAQSDAQGAGEWIVGRLDAETDPQVREQAVFALSQLDDGTDWLLKILRSKRDSQTIRRALFWLGQSNDPRAIEEISKILDR